MTSKEKAKELYDNFLHLLPDSGDISKQDIQQCAIRAVDEKIEVLRDLGYDNDDHRIIYQLEVKQEIESL
jgi:hypothetical protein